MSNKNKHSEIATLSIHLATQRVTMKLREKEFSFGDYDHLYLCFSSDKSVNSICLDEKVDCYFPWLRNVYIGVSEQELQTIDTTEDVSVILKQIEKVLLTLFGKDPSTEQIIQESIEQAKLGKEMLMRFKEKKVAKGTATIYLRLLDNGHYLPLLTVNKTDGTEVLRVDLEETRDLDPLGEIQLSNKKVTIKP